MSYSIVTVIELEVFTNQKPINMCEGEELWEQHLKRETQSTIGGMGKGGNKSADIFFSFC